MRDWIELYLDFTKYQASPTLFHRWCAIAVLGAAMERRVWLTRGYESLRLYPGQLMVVLVGKSAMEKKTTACNFATDLVTHLEPWQLRVLPKKTSPQRLLRLLARVDEEGLPMRYPAGHPAAGRRVNSTGFVNAGELAVFFSTDNFNEMLAATINDLNDAKSGKQTIEFQSWQSELWNPLVGLLGAITPKGLAQELPKAARTAGFFGRILWVHSSGGARANDGTEPIPEEKVLKIKLREGISALANMYGPMQFTKQGVALFREWYHKVYVPHLEKLDSTDTIDTTGYWGRKDSHLLRIAIVCAASRSWGKEMLLRAVDIQRAIDYLGEIEKGFAAAMAEIGVGPYSEENTRILNFVESRAKRNKDGWVPEKEVGKYGNALGMRQFHLADCLARLLLAEELETAWKDGKKCWRRRWTSGRLVRKASEEREVSGRR